MGLDTTDTVDAAGVENETGYVVLTIADSWDWADESRHLVALQAKLNSYFEFVQSGQVYSEYPQGAGRKIVISIVGRYPIPPIGVAFLEKASAACGQLGVSLRSQVVPGPGDGSN